MRGYLLRGQLLTVVCYSVEWGWQGLELHMYNTNKKLLGAGGTVSHFLLVFPATLALGCLFIIVPESANPILLSLLEIYIDGTSPERRQLGVTGKAREE